MALDGLVIHAVVRELQACVGGRISKIHQPNDTDIALQIRAQGHSYKLLLSANPTYPRVHLTGGASFNPLEAPMFCMLLRKHCENGVIEAIEQVGLERIIRIRVRHRDELGDLSSKLLVVELMGRHSNVILVDPANGTILDGIHHVTPAISSYRIVLPGAAYVSPPEQHKADPLTVTREDFLARLDTDGTEQSGAEGGAASPELPSLLVQQFAGISPLIAKETVFRTFGSSWKEKAKEYDTARSLHTTLWEPFAALMTQVREHRYEPTIVIDRESGRWSFSVVALTHLPGDRLTFDTVSECLESFYGDKAERDTVKQRTSDLLKFLQNEKAKNSKKLEKLQETLEDAKEADSYRIKGELLTASLHLFKRGDRQVTAPNYYDEEQGTMTIELDPLLTPSDNAQKYFKRYTKIKNSVSVVQEQMEAAREEIRYLDALLQQVQGASLQDVEEIREELAEQGYVRDRRKKLRKKKKNEKPVISCFTSSEGIPIYVGKNNTQNEYLTNRLAQASDTWLHTKDIPGSHVVIRSTSFGEETLREAAMLAAYHSQAKDSSQVPVDYTLIRHVRKPNGAKPGFVIYDHQKTIFITPDPQEMKALLATRKSS
ncbi:hypothetical protein J31TS4_00030 [Paenibacillus sp. J31TS4]|uniref:Rqc2 family fibronectin-binding protein n=1 Tax=Paenibacillus sp. J31TS4 TaxID=2807195 RepID=UPI001B126DB0|nr:NFACT RNA binding domain-containing protein [Paenibacillus sp. J31TS4]GIP36723.1 hypothetical protein J31TS4_00030 [Paenibacillus sp. J31TS4]